MLIFIKPDEVHGKIEFIMNHLEYLRETGVVFNIGTIEGSRILTEYFHLNLSAKVLRYRLDICPGVQFV